MMRRLVYAALAMIVIGGVPLVSGQVTAPLEFEVVSIKRNTNGPGPGGFRTLPDGTTMIVNSPIAGSILRGAPAGIRETQGLPEWTRSERYDITAKPPVGASGDQLREMWRAMFADRMKLRAHTEQQERDVYEVQLAREDGRLGPNLKPSTLDCANQGRGAAPPAQAAPAQPTPEEMRGRCGSLMRANTLVSGGMPIDILAFQLGTAAGVGPGINRTGLTGFYAVDLTFSRQPLSANPAAAAPTDDPDIFTAIQQQLGLKLVKTKAQVTIFVVDSIERPSEN